MHNFHNLYDSLVLLSILSPKKRKRRYIIKIFFAKETNQIYQIYLKYFLIQNKTDTHQNVHTTVKISKETKMQ